MYEATHKSSSTKCFNVFWYMSSWHIVQTINKLTHTLIRTHTLQKNREKKADWVKIFKCEISAFKYFSLNKHWNMKYKNWIELN